MLSAALQHKVLKEAGDGTECTAHAQVISPKSEDTISRTILR